MELGTSRYHRADHGNPDTASHAPHQIIQTRSGAYQHIWQVTHTHCRKGHEDCPKGCAEDEIWPNYAVQGNIEVHPPECKISVYQDSETANDHNSTIHFLKYSAGYKGRDQGSNTTGTQREPVSNAEYPIRSCKNWGSITSVP